MDRKEQIAEFKNARISCLIQNTGVSVLCVVVSTWLVLHLAQQTPMWLWVSVEIMMMFNILRCIIYSLREYRMASRVEKIMITSEELRVHISDLHDTLTEMIEEGKQRADKKE